MPDYSDQSNPPSDVCLLLRAYAEQRWLSREVVPVLRQLETRDELPEEQLGAALAYLEVTWLEAARHAAETDAAFAALEDTAADGDGGLPCKARRYHAAVRFLREAVARNVATFVCVGENAEVACTPEPCGDGRLASAWRAGRPEVRPA